MRISFVNLAAFTLASCLGCTTQHEALTLPKGDAERGQTAFVEFQCTECHAVHNVDLGIPSTDSAKRPFMLGGDMDYEKTYEDLVTGIINPSHRIAKGYQKDNAPDDESPMRVYNDVMTVSQLIDIVTFLEKHYEYTPPRQYPEYVYVP